MAMAVVDHPQERAWCEGERQTVALMGTVNAAMAQLVSTIAMLIATDGWHGHGIRSVEHWVTWKACVSESRASGLVRIARRIQELPRCWALFEAGQITEDIMVQLARRVPATRDAEMARQVPDLLASQLRRILRSCPELPDGTEKAWPAPERERYVRSYQHPDGWLQGEFCLPPEEAPLFQNAMGAARDAEFRDRADLHPAADLADLPVGATRAGVTWADAFVRLLSEATDALDPSLQRTGYRGERHQIVLHHDIDPEGRLGPGQLNLGDVLPQWASRYFACDAQVRLVVKRAGEIIGISPAARTPSRALRRALERRDQGCTHPLCSQRRWVQAHHLRHWEDGGPTEAWNLICLCPQHHRELHAGDFSIEGNPETGTLRFLDARGRPIEPPGTGPTGELRLVEPVSYHPPYGGRLATGSFGWN